MQSRATSLAHRCPSIRVWGPKPRNLFCDEAFLMPLTAYLDGANTEGRAMTLTCLAATESMWREVESRWLDETKKHGDPAYLHMTDLMAIPPRGIYEGWSEDQVDGLVWGLIESLCSFMDRPNLQSFTCRVNLAAYEKWKLVRRLTAPSRLCVRIAFPQMVEWFLRPQRDVFLDVIDVFFDRNESFMRHIRADWKSEKIRREYPVWNLVRVIEETDIKATPALQMADFICWGFHRQGTYTHPRPWEVDDHHYTIAVRASNAVRGTFTEVGELALANDTFREEGQALVELWRQRGQVVNNPSEEYTKFDRMMRRLMHVPNSQTKVKLDAEKAAKDK
jgi:hypothetical protein